MTDTHSPGAESAGTLDEQAALWFTRRHGQRMSEADSHQFENWLKTSPAHAQAYESIAGVWREFEAMPRPATVQQPARKSIFSPLWRPLGHSVAALFIAAILLLPYSKLPALLLDNMTLVTSDNPKEVTLPDGSQVFLNNQTRLRVAYETSVRHIYLDEGSVYFNVKSNPYRPFIIQADGREIKVVGTQFEVSNQQHQVTVQVSQGVVSFKTGEMQKNQYLLAGDEAVSGSENSNIILSKINAQDVASWRFGELVFTDKPLAEILTQLKPYSGLEVELSPPSLAQQKISGRIDVRQPERFFQALPQLLPVQVIYKDKNNVLIINNKKSK
ncbi:FecR domain-containing protein [uncultured Cedecea sp.]|uniref:FecR family protein n=1 Tax=uncultured Cedecea sp. TaxID=988762 RepID=UPI0026200BD5|nr:FecR domain-containing protein [uncultured Cedecea sp.]